MRLGTKFILFTGITHLTAFGLAFFILRNNPLFFFGCEILILISLLIAWKLYNELIAPMNMLLRGGDALADKDFTSKYIKTGKYEMDKLIDIFNNMVDELKKERTMQQEQHFFLQQLIVSAPVAIIVYDFDGNISTINKKGLEVLEVNEGQPKDAKHELLEAGERLGRGESKVLLAKGFRSFKIQKSHFMDRGFTRDFLMIEELTNEIAATEKQVYGKVIRMMAHEVNNTVGPVNSIIDTALGKHELWEGKHAVIRKALEVAMERNKNLGTFVKNFAELVRLPLPNKQLVELKDLLFSAGKLFEFRAHERNVHIVYDLGEEGWEIMADKSQLEQVLVNLIKNALEAIEGPGTIRLVVNRAQRQLIVKDTGVGIDPEFSDQLFSPFFSTKKDGQGIGLTLVKEILLNHDLDFGFSKDGEGHTCFTIQF